MRRQSLPAILLLCFGILIIDILAFYWLQSITRLITSDFLKNLIHLVFWVFTFGLISAILFLRVRLKYIHPRQRQLVIASFYGLTVSSFVPKIIFVVVISFLYFTNYIFSEEESKVVVPMVGLFSGLLPFMVISIGIFRTLYRFKIHRIHIGFRYLPENLEGIRIVHISDLHLGSFNFRYKILERAVKMINDLGPDFIFFTGDMVNNYKWELTGWQDVLKKLYAKKGKYSILGNHDYGDYSVWPRPEAKKENFEAIKNFHADIGFHLLLNESKVVNIKDDKLAIIGVENWGRPPFKQYGDLQKAMANINDIPFKILLSHDPSHWEEEVAGHTDINLTLSGHTHGMQAGVRVRKREWSPIKYRYKHWAGLYTRQNQHLYVNRGLGWLGFPGRIGMRPEITLIEIRKE